MNLVDRPDLRSLALLITTDPLINAGWCEGKGNPVAIA